MNDNNASVLNVGLNLRKLKISNQSIVLNQTVVLVSLLKFDLDPPLLQRLLSTPGYRLTGLDFW